MTKKKNRGTGAGGAKTNLNGINFEEKMYLYNWIINSGYTLIKISTSKKSTPLFKIFYNFEFLGWYGTQGNIYKALKKEYPNQMNDKYIKEVFSKKIFPDAFILSIRKNKLTIFEKKWQQTAGSVDEKIQTAPFKLEMFHKLLRHVGLELSYQYILSEWFINKMYRNIKEYYHDKKEIRIWINNENLDQLDIEEYI
ncbi:MAG: hypothetical protein HRT99_01190 [Mycoplasmatales bacterium]|nr:hypothetical protein [Mycoplasmatales bacterium]